AADEIARGIEALERHGGSDLLIVARGGGSLEDLWAFNEEVTARAIAACRIPVVSAVGHEIDHTIADLVADVRAPTPSTAAEMAVPDSRAVLQQMRRTLGRCEGALGRKIAESRLKLEALGRSRALQSPLDRLLQESQRADELLQRARRALEMRVARARERVAMLQARIEALNPVRVLERGYALAFDEAGRLLRSAGETSPGERVRVELGRGAILCRVEGREEERAWSAGAGRRGPETRGGRE
ncbi:unnamed protein product, partial [marine sediment metagenome]